MRSIRKHLNARLISGLALLTAVVCAGLFVGVRAVLIRDFDQSLSAKLRSFASLVQYGGNGKFEIDLDPALMPEYRHVHNAEYFEVWIGDKVLRRSDTLQSHDLPQRGEREDRPVLWNMTLPDGRPGRAAGIHFVPIEDREDSNTTEGIKPHKPMQFGKATLVIARDRVGLDRMLFVLLAAMLAMIVIVPMAAAMLVTSVVRRGLRPLDELGNRAAAIDASTLTERFNEKNLPDELEPISHRLNLLLDRLQEAFTRERRFSADAAHELRTPIAELRSTTEVALKWADDPQLAEGALRDAHAISLQMERLVSALLALTRADTGHAVIALEPLNLKPLLAQAWHPLIHVAGEAGLEPEFDWSTADSAAVMGDKTLLIGVLANLFENAVHYGTPGALRSCVSANAMYVQISLENGTRNLVPADLALMLQPFWRKDHARSDHDHSGLGLALVCSHARLMEGEIRVELPSPGMFRITLDLPRAEMPADLAAHPV